MEKPESTPAFVDAINGPEPTPAEVLAAMGTPIDTDMNDVIPPEGAVFIPARSQEPARVLVPGKPNNRHQRRAQRAFNRKHAKTKKENK